MTVDEILATGRYTDRRGRTWEPSDMLNEWFGGIPGDPLDRSWWCSPREMRLLIERDMHECDGFGELPDCQSHPVPIVIVGYDEGEWADFRVRFRGSSATYSSHRAAMDAARALAVGE